MEDKFTVSEFIAYCNQTLEYAYSGCVIEGEVTSLKTSQGKWVFFDLKDEESSVNCFIPVWNLRVELSEGMKVLVKGTPKVTAWGKFSLTVQAIQPVGEGNIKKSFEALKKKLEKEGIFDAAKKRPLPRELSKIGVISSTQAAGYADFIKIINERWGGLEIFVCHTQVQGLAAPDQIIRALEYLNERSEVEVIAIIRGGGSADDLACFNDEKLVRKISSSKIPVITGIGHEVDESLSDLAADVVASTPSNAAQMLTKDKKAEISNLHDNISRIKTQIISRVELAQNDIKMKTVGISAKILSNIESSIYKVDNLKRVLKSLNPENVLKNGYAIITGKIKVGEEIGIETEKSKIKAKISEIKEKK
ncbi:MAG: exodeoxyribonuclease VII large subunit [Candidatus Saccharibacteria bacterium]|nr:exodeoxyribonuclease VII large subunit [Candidatus Saccharibacteria bacterium]